MQEISKSCKYFSGKTCKICTKSCTSCTKMKLFLQHIKNLARKICKIMFLQDFVQILQENYLTMFSCKILARLFISCKKRFIFCVRLARYVQDLVQDLASLARKILARFPDFCKKVLLGYVSTS